MQRDEKQLISWLQTRRVNTITELRRVEKAFITFPSPSPSPEAAESLTNAWLHYVNSNQLLNELRSLTKSYPFSSECLDEAKWLVIGDIDFSRSSNYCRVVLAKVMTMYVYIQFIYLPFTAFGVLTGIQEPDTETCASCCV